MNSGDQTGLLNHRDWIIVVLILGFVITAWTIDSVRKSEMFNSDMHLVANMVSKDLNPTLFVRDYFFGR